MAEDEKKLQRVFVGINIKVADGLIDECVKLQAACGDLTCKFIPPEDMHLTLVPPWEEKDVQWAKDTLHQSVRDLPAFELKLQKLSYGPFDTQKPRLVWVECAPTEELVELKKALMKEFDASETIPFIPHITLARIPEGEDRELPDIERDLGLSMEVNFVDLFTAPNKEGEGYETLDSAMLSPNGTPH